MDAPHPPNASANRHGLSRRFLIAISLALIPIGIIAIALSINSFRDARMQAIDRVDARGTALALGVDDVLADHGLALRALAARSADSFETQELCNDHLTRFSALDQMFGRLLRLSQSGRIQCLSDEDERAGLSPNLSQQDIDRIMSIEMQGAGTGSALFFSEQREYLIYAVRNAVRPARIETVVALIPIDALSEELGNVIRPVDSRVRIQIQDGAGSPVDIGPIDPEQSGARAMVASTRLSGLSVRYEEDLPPFDLGEIAAISAPLVMWLAALFISWLTLRRLVVSPLASMQRGILKRADGDMEAKLLPRAGNTLELAEFAQAFDDLAAEQQIDRQHREIALAAQQRMVREVHHRVKNNLQIITSLISLKGRGTDDRGEQRAYGTIQMRVTALAHVHRWLHADDLSRGVDLAALMTDLCAGLEGSIRAVEGVATTIETRLARLFVGQDSAVPFSFLVTEIIAGTAARMTGDQEMLLQVTLTKVADGLARLEVCGRAFTGENRFTAKHATPSARIVQGMIRQLRSELHHDSEKGIYAFEMAVAKDDESGGRDRAETVD